MSTGWQAAVALLLLMCVAFAALHTGMSYQFDAQEQRAAEDRERIAALEQAAGIPPRTVIRARRPTLTNRVRRLLWRWLPEQKRNGARYGNAEGAAKAAERRQERPAGEGTDVDTPPITSERNDKPRNPPTTSAFTAGRPPVPTPPPPPPTTRLRSLTGQITRRDEPRPMADDEDDTSAMTAAAHDHQWIDVTTYGDADLIEQCGICGARRSSPRVGPETPAQARARQREADIQKWQAEQRRRRGEDR